MAEMVYDEKVGWYDPDIEYCIEGCGRRATRTVPVSMGLDPSHADALGEPTGAYMVMEHRCDQCE